MGVHVNDAFRICLRLGSIIAISYKSFIKPEYHVQHVNCQRNHPKIFLCSIIKDRLASSLTRPHLVPPFHHNKKPSEIAHIVTGSIMKSNRQRLYGSQPPPRTKVTLPLISVKVFLPVFIVNNCFPQNQPPRTRFSYWNTLKINYSYMPNIPRIIASHD